MASKVNIREKLGEGWLHANIIIELLGKPADYLEKVINAAIDRLGNEKNVELIGKKVHPPKLVEGAKNAYTTFGEIEILISGVHRLIEIIFDYMPASVEIVEPSTIKFKLEDANALLNDLTMRLHQYDALSKKLRLEREILVKKLQQLEGKKEIKETSEKKK